MSSDRKSGQQGLSYRDAGVDIDAGNTLVERIKPYAKSTLRPGVLGGLGGFGALFEIPLDRYRNPVLVAGTDGVGTKLKLAMELNKHDTIGIDLVAMCANDLIVQGAEPLFFLDYYATGRLNVDAAADVVKGIAAGCSMAGAALTGGETAEMPGMYQGDDYDLAGFCVGIVEKSEVIDGSRVAEGDAIIGLASSGIHSNGFSLVRKVLEVSGTGLDTDFRGRPIGEVLLEPTRIYIKSLLKLFRDSDVDVHALAHITGGGLPENLPRVLPDGARALIEAGSWMRPPIFDWLQSTGGISDEEMYRTFNCGIGMAVCVPGGQAQLAAERLREQGEEAVVIGHIEAGDGERVVIR